MSRSRLVYTGCGGIFDADFNATKEDPETGRQTDRRTGIGVWIEPD